MALRRLLLSLILLLCLSAAPAAAQLVEAWRSPWGVVTSVSVDPDDGSCWAAVGDKVIHFAPDGSVLSETPGFFWPSAVSVNRADNSCWVAEYGITYYEHYSAPRDGLDRVAHIGEDGEVLWSGAGFNSPWDLSANPTDGSCWVADTGNDQVVHLGADGSELWRGGGFSSPLGVSVNEADGSCWVADTYNYQVAHLAADGTEIWRNEWHLGRPELVSVNPADGSCWVACGGGDINHLAADGTRLNSFDTWPTPTSLSVNPADGSWWTAVFDYWWDAGEPEPEQVAEVRHYAPDGTELWRGNQFDRPESVSVNSADGSCWVGDRWANQIVHLDEQGNELLRVGEASSPWCVSVNPTDGSAWVIDWDSPNVTRPPSLELVHYRADGEELWRGGDLETPWSVSVNPADGSCWVSDVGAVVHLAADGTELHRVTEVAAPSYLSVDSSDGSCWVSDSRDLVHLAADGTVLWRGGGFSYVGRLAASPSDGSCWVIDCDGFYLVHVAADGAEVWRSDDGSGCQVAVNPADGSCWATDMGTVTHYSAEGVKLSDTPVMCCAWTLAVDPRDGSCWVAANSSFDLVRLSSEGVELSRQKGVLWADSIAVNPLDGSLWIADGGAGQVAHLAAPLFPDVPFGFWANREIELCADAGIVTGYDDSYYRPESPVSRDQMAVFIARALAGGDENVPDGPHPARATFDDVPGDHWAYRHIEYCAANGIVHGLGPGAYGPTIDVIRAQMAAFIARAAAGGDESVPDGPAEATFNDVPTDHWAYKYVEYCGANGIVEGYDPVTYGPTGTVSRAQMAVFISRAFELPI